MAILLGMTQTSSVLGLAGFTLTLAIFISGLVASLSRSVTTRHESRRLLLMQGVLGFFALWAWCSWTFPLAAWALWIGDNDHWFWDASFWIAGATVVAWHARVYPRMVDGRVSVRFKRFHRVGVAGLWLLAAVIWFADFVHPIIAADPRRAAETLVHGFDFGESVRLVETPVDESQWARPTKIRRFLVMGQLEPRGWVTVVQHGHFWWRSAGNHYYAPSAHELERARQWLQQPQSRDGARLILQEVINTRPGTNAAKEAEQLLRTHGLQLPEPSDLPSGLHDAGSK